MQFIDIVRRLRQEAGIAGSGPASVQFQTGENKRLVDWVASAWNDIQIAETDWMWMQGEFSFTTTAGQQAYTATDVGATRLNRWHTDSIRLSLTFPNDETKLTPLVYSDFRDTYMTGSNPDSRPVYVSFSPDYKLLLGYTPNDAYFVRGEYYKTPQKLTLDTDVPEMPEQFHEAVLYSALMKYARYMAAGEIFEDAMANYRRIMAQLRVHQLPPMGMPETLA
jgi:hypothetical protein